jgi:hypothetical protein
MTRNLMKQLDQIVEIDMENFIIKTNWCIGAGKGLPMTKGPNQPCCCIDKKYLVLKELHFNGANHKRRIVIW